jgi:hypothetical protein
MLDDCKIIKLPKIEDDRGHLTPIEGERDVPFAIKRAYYLYDVPQGAERGGHAHRKLCQFIVAVSGSFEVHLDDGKNKQTFVMNKGDEGLYVCPMTWRTIDGFTEGSVCLVLASDHFFEEDYLRDYKEFERVAKA